MTTLTTSPELSTHLAHPAAGETTLYLVRHGQTGSNVQRALCGRLDVPLDPVGLRQARAIGERISRDVQADALLSSPLQRAMTTAWSIGERIGLEPIPVPDLMELHFGALEGMTLAQVEAEHPEIIRRLADPDDHDLTWPEGESRREFHQRVFAIFQGILTYYASHAVIVVAHGGVIGSFLAQIRGVSPNNPRTFDVPNCGFTHLAVTADHTQIHICHDVTHLSW